jgi:PKHD-type hydroxylase
MRLQQPYCVYEGQFSAGICDRIIELGNSLTTMNAEVAHDPENNLRDSVVSWVRHNEDTAWLYDLISAFVRETNALYWNWVLSGPESMQYTQYGPEQFYTWHADQRRQPYDAESRWPGQIRKISISVHLSDGSDYEGGEFVIENIQTPPDDMDKRLIPLNEARTRGSAIVFPSHLYHRVNPVLSGTRRSLVTWFLGPPFV